MLTRIACRRCPVFIIPYLPSWGQAKTFLVEAAPRMPADKWWITLCVLAILFAAAIADARTGKVPDSLIISGLFCVATLQGFFLSWDAAAYRLGCGVIAGLAIWAVNMAWYRIFHHDALGMGDAKWTALAISYFGVAPAIVAWGVGSVLATIFIGMFRLFNYRVSKVTFAPFLFIGLGVGLYRGLVW
ncbi:MAG: prepilin peptidase [Alphaproteobacteria bacterium]|nr:prepilin peptidase [Alphaproteobacteria bacterium]